MPTEKKQNIINDLKDKFRRAKAVFFVDYKGINASKISALRTEVRENDGEIEIAKILWSTLPQVKTSAINLPDRPQLYLPFLTQLPPLSQLTSFLKKFSYLLLKLAFLMED